MSQSYYYPPSGSGSSSNASVAPNLGPIPGSSTLIAGDNAGVQTPVTVNSDGAVLTTPDAGSLQNVNLTEVGGAAVSLGQKTSSASIPVVIASDDTVAISASSLPLPTGAATSALQTSGNSSLTTIATNTGTIATNTTGVATAANQVTGNSSLSTIATNTTGVSTAANQVTGNSSLATIATNTTGVATAANQATEISSLSTIATNQTSGGQKTQLATPTALTIHQAQVTIGTTAVRLTYNGSAPSATRVALVFTPAPTSTATFYIGSSTVTNAGSTAGIALTAGQTFIANNDAGDYWVVASASTSGLIMEQE